MVVMASSVPLIIRVMISVQAQASADTEAERMPRMKRAGAGAQDDQHADQADRGRDPAAQADLLAGEDDRQRGDEQRRDEAGGGGLRNGQEPQAGDEEQRRPQQRRAAQQLQAEPAGAQREQGEPGIIAGVMIIAKPGSGSRRSRSRAVSPRDISPSRRGAEKDGRGQHQRCP
jgi:hypothetical protein